MVCRWEEGAFVSVLLHAVRPAVVVIVGLQWLVYPGAQSVREAQGDVKRHPFIREFDPRVSPGGSTHVGHYCCRDSVLSFHFLETWTLLCAVVKSVNCGRHPHQRQRHHYHRWKRQRQLQQATTYFRSISASPTHPLSTSAFRTEPPDLPESDDATEEGQSFVVHYGSERIPVQTTPGTELGEGQVFNLPRPLESQIEITPLNATAGQTISISEVRWCSESAVALFFLATDKLLLYLGFRSM